MIAEEEVLPPFKRTSLTNNAAVKKRLWKSLKQITSYERTLSWSDDAVTCKYIFITGVQEVKRLSYLKINSIFADSSVNSLPSFKPAKKYSDISGLVALYTDPQTKLYYNNADEFATIRNFPMDLTAGYLALRGASSIVG